MNKSIPFHVSSIRQEAHSQRGTSVNGTFIMVGKYIHALSIFTLVYKEQVRGLNFAPQYIKIHKLVFRWKKLNFLVSSSPCPTHLWRLLCPSPKMKSWLCPCWSPSESSLYEMNTSQGCLTILRPKLLYRFTGYMHQMEQSVTRLL